jgi:hypothetical protein
MVIRLVPHSSFHLLAPRHPYLRLQHDTERAFVQVEAALSSKNPCEASCLASAAVQNAYRKSTGEAPEEGDSDAAGESGPPPDEECPICYEDFKARCLFRISEKQLADGLIHRSLNGLRGDPYWRKGRRIASAELHSACILQCMQNCMHWMAMHPEHCHPSAQLAPRLLDSCLHEGSCPKVFEHAHFMVVEVVCSGA